jgi:microcompartment protein CcmK/EutM
MTVFEVTGQVIGTDTEEKIKRKKKLLKEF